MKLYKISTGQFVTIIVLGILMWIAFTFSALGKYNSTAIDFLPTLIIPAALIFYGIGWKRARPKKISGQSKVKVKIDDDAKKLNEFYAVPVWKFLLLSIMSLGIYVLYWAAKNFQQIQKQIPEKKISPIWRALLLPFFFYQLSKKIEQSALNNGYHQRVYPEIITVFFVIFTILTRIEVLGIIFFLLSVVIMLPVVHAANFVNIKNSRTIHDKLRGRDLIILFIWPLIFLIWFLYVEILALSKSPEEASTAQENVIGTQSDQKKVSSCINYEPERFLLTSNRDACSSNGQNFIRLDSTKAEYKFSEAPVRITGSVSSGAESISVIAQSAISEPDIYTLKDFTSGDRSFYYGVGEDFDNMYPGENKYTIVVYFSDGSVEVSESVISFINDGLTTEEEFDQQVMNNNLERKCQSAAYEDFQRTGLPGYGWQAHWNTELGICVQEVTGWDTEIPGNWNRILWDVGNQKNYGSITIYNSRVAAGLQSKNENPSKNGELKICVMQNNNPCSTLDEWHEYREWMMTK